MGRDFGLGKLANRVAKDPLFLSRSEIHVVSNSITQAGRLKLESRGCATDRTRMQTRLGIAAITLCCVALPTPGSADVTAFVGSARTPSHRMARGFALGMSLLLLGFEFEFSDSLEDQMAGAPSLRTGMFNVLLQTRSPIGLQFYGTVGGGLYRERLGAVQNTHGGINAGGGVKLTLAGPLRARLDYRVFTLQGNPLFSRPQRIYAGLNLAF